MKRAALAALATLTVASLARPSLGNEGQWTPDQLADHQATLAKLGLSLKVEELWNPLGDERSGGLLRAAVKLNGCSGAFISKRGLIATNHHCAYGALQANSSVDNDYLRDGFVASSSAKELPAEGRTVRVLRKQSDVTDKIRPEADAIKDDAARARQIERRQKEIVDACEAASSDLRCEVASFYNGSEYRLFEYLELRDLRVVYAPPAAVGEYGGEIDNWMWPRHTGDFALLRAYVGPDQKPADASPQNVPYTPGRWLEVSAQGVSPGDFVGVLGYPGRTQRYLSAPEVQRNIEQVLPGIVDLYGEWISILEEEGQGDPAVKIKVAALKKSLANRHKNARGMLDGLDHMKLLEARRGEERKLRAWAEKPENQRYAEVLDQLAELSANARRHHPVDTLLSAARRGPNTLAVAIDLVRHARARALPDLERPAGFRERDAARLWKRQSQRLKNFDAEVDAQLIASLLARAAAVDAEAKREQLGELSRVAASKGGRPGERRSYIGRARSMVNESALRDPAKVEALWNEASADELRRSKDPMLVAANSLVDLIEAKRERDDAMRGARARLRPMYFDMLRELRGGPIYPDANGTLRMSFATVRPYTKWDGAQQVAQTTLTGAVEKHTGADPFDLPAKVRQGAKAAKHTYWSDPQLDDLAVCFLADADTTGGNSGSPVIDGQGRLVGFNFDRVWENIAGDFAYYEGHSRNISADVRHLLWMLDEVEDATALLEEIGVAKYADMPSRASVAPPAATGASGATGAEPAPAESTPASDASAGSPSGCACGIETQPGPGSLALAVLGLFGILRRGHRRREGEKNACTPPTSVGPGA